MNAIGFWEWFTEKQEQYFAIDKVSISEKELLMESLQDKLHEFSEGLFANIGTVHHNKRELIITAESNIDYFEKVEELVSASPILNHWNVIAFKPAVQGDFVIEFDGLELDSRELWFLPMQHKQNKKLFGLTIGIPGFDAENREHYLNAIYQLLDLMLGEKTVTTEIHYLDICELSSEPEEEGFMRISELKRYMEWHKDGIVPYSFSLN